jgi:tRNA-modifying protein YgfZ
MSLKMAYEQAGARLAPDGIPLDFGDRAAEYQAGLTDAILLDRSHEGRIVLTGNDRLDLLDRISTNALTSLQPGEGRPTLFTNANARLLDRVMVYAWKPDALLVLTGPGRLKSVGQYLQNNIFFNDDVALTNVHPATHLFTLHGPATMDYLTQLAPATAGLGPLHGVQTTIDGLSVFIGKDKPISGHAVHLICAQADAEAIWKALVRVGILPSGGLVYHALRVRSGQPAVGFELTQDFIPLELGLWDEVSFAKGCYTGQEIIARMESRGQLAKTIVQLAIPAMIQPGSDLTTPEGRRAGKLTSSVQAPDGAYHAIGVVKTDYATAGTSLKAGEQSLQVIRPVGVQPLTRR